MITNKVVAGDILIIPHKQKWTADMIRKIMVDETQIGTLVQGKPERTSFKNHKPIPKPKEEWIRVPYCHDANLDLETFKIVSAMFEKTRKNRPQKMARFSCFLKRYIVVAAVKYFIRIMLKLKLVIKNIYSVEEIHLKMDIFVIIQSQLI